MNKEETPVAIVWHNDTLRLEEGLVVHIDTSIFNAGDKLYISPDRVGTLVVKK